MPDRLRQRAFPYKVRVAIDEARHDHSAGRIDFVGLARQREIFHSPAGADFSDHAVDDQNRAVLNEPQAPEICPAPGAARSAQRQQLPGPTDQRYPHVLA